MEPKFQTSFIPKKPLDSSSNRVGVVHETDIFATAATLVFISTILMYGGLFMYKNILNKEIETKKEELKKAEVALDPVKIKKILDSNSRITATNQLLEKHVATSRLLNLLGELSVKKMKLDDLLYSSKLNGPAITFNAEVQSYNALATQEDIYSKSEYVKNPTFSGIILSDTGNIKFKFSAEIDNSYLSYKKKLEIITINE